MPASLLSQHTLNQRVTIDPLIIPGLAVTVNRQVVPDLTQELYLLLVHTVNVILRRVVIIDNRIQNLACVTNPLESVSNFVKAQARVKTNSQLIQVSHLGTIVRHILFPSSIQTRGRLTETLLQRLKFLSVSKMNDNISILKDAQ